MIRGIAIAGALFAMVAAPAGVQAKRDKRVERVVESTRNTKATFAVISDIYVNLDSKSPQQFVGGEYHKDDLHRIDDANVRVVANCATLAGTMLLIAKKELQRSAEVALTACRIARRDVLQSSFLGKIKYNFGDAYRIQITDQDFIRTYDVMSNGALVRNIWQSNNMARTVRYRMQVVRYCEGPLPEEWFKEASLNQTQVAQACK